MHMSVDLPAQGRELRLIMIMISLSGSRRRATARRARAPVADSTHFLASTGTGLEN